MHPAVARSDRFDFVHKLRLFPDRVEAVLDRNLPAALSTVYLDVNTDICNHACTFCDGFYRTLRAGQIPWTRLERLVVEMQEMGVLAVLLAGDRGEPLLHPEIDQLLSRIVGCGIQYGLYTNGTIIGEQVWPWLPHATFIRVSADAGTAPTHRRMHVYPAGRGDFAALLSNVEHLARRVADVGISFVLDEENYREIAVAADTFLHRGATFIEYKPKYLAGYRVDGRWLRSAASEIQSQLGVAATRWQDRIVVNNQLDQLLSPNPHPQLLQTTPRRCLTSLLRLVISTHGCYTCTPYRGEHERRVGDILQDSLLSIVESSVRHATVARPCSRRCAYHEQNDALLAAEALRPLSLEPPEVGRLSPALSGTEVRRSNQDAFM